MARIVVKIVNNEGGNLFTGSPEREVEVEIEDGSEQENRQVIKAAEYAVKSIIKGE